MMPEQKMSYEERVMKLAFTFDDLENADEYDAARITVAAQAEAVRSVLIWALPFDSGDIERYLLEHGYKPKTEEDAN